MGTTTYIRRICSFIGAGLNCSEALRRSFALVAIMAQMDYWNCNFQAPACIFAAIVFVGTDIWIKTSLNIFYISCLLGDEKWEQVLLFFFFARTVKHVSFIPALVALFILFLLQFHFYDIFLIKVVEWKNPWSISAQSSKCLWASHLYIWIICEISISLYSYTHSSLSLYIICISYSHNSP